MIAIITFILSLFSNSLYYNSSNYQDNPTEQKTIVWKADTYDFGKIIQGSVVKHTFIFTNKGTTPAVIKSANASCGCTIPTYSKEPIAPEGEGSVTARFDSSGKLGVQAKTVTVVINDETFYLTIKCNIEKAQEKVKSPVLLGN